MPGGRRRPRLRGRDGEVQNMMDWLARTYVHAMNCIHYCHDRYNYRAVHDGAARPRYCAHHGLRYCRPVGRCDSLSAIKYAKVKPIRDENGLVVDYETTGDFPKFRQQRSAGGRHRCRPRQAFYGLSATASDLPQRRYIRSRCLPSPQTWCTGKGTGNTPDGRRKGEPFAPGANPMHGRDSHGWLASCLSVACLPYKDAEDGISYTLSVVPGETRQGDAEAITRAISALDTFFGRAAST